MVSVSEEDKLGVGREDDASDSRIAARASQMVCHEERDEHSGSGKNRKETEWRRGCGKPLAEAAREARGQRYREYPVLADRFPANNWKCKRNEPPCDSSIIESLISVWTPSLSSSFSHSLSLSLSLSCTCLSLISLVRVSSFYRAYESPLSLFSRRLRSFFLVLRSLDSGGSGWWRSDRVMRCHDAAAHVLLEQLRVWRASANIDCTYLAYESRFRESLRALCESVVDAW